ncbi:MAG: hypothetical protein RLZZ165_1054, partial [Bacteroidota bacterium]
MGFLPSSTSTVILLKNPTKWFSESSEYLISGQQDEFKKSEKKSGMNNTQKLEALRAEMQRCHLAAWILPSNDPHQSEYVAAHWKSLEWISGFTGSAGTAVVTMTEAGLWTDSRYFLQAEQELKGTHLSFHPQKSTVAPEHLEWVKAKLKRGDRVGVDARLYSIEGLASLRSAFGGTGIEVDSDSDPVAVAWQDRPMLPEDPIFEHPIELAGRSATEKLEDIRKAMKAGKATHHLVVSLDDIAWIFNLRGRDVNCNPVFYAYALIGLEEAMLFVQPGKLSGGLCNVLSAAGIRLLDYDALPGILQGLQGRLLWDPSLVSAALVPHLGTDCVPIIGASPSTMMKSKKTSSVVAHIRKSMEKDGVALLRLCRWLEEQMGSREVTEHEVAERLAACRAEQEGYFGESFLAIAGYAGNGAIVHYRPASQGSAVLKPMGVFLLDSGGQYADGTTDITRTFALGPVPEEAVMAYNMVLKGHIALAKARFPEGTVGYQLDPLARMHLWSEGLNYGHGTGHGVGYFLNVHEGPHGISPLANGKSRVPLEAGMIISNEPGYYAPGQFGIRI